MGVGDTLRNFGRLWANKIGPGIESAVGGVEKGLFPTRQPTGWDVALASQDLAEPRGVLGNLARYGGMKARANVAQEGLEQRRASEEASNAYKLAGAERSTSQASLYESKAEAQDIINSLGTAPDQAKIDLAHARADALYTKGQRDIEMLQVARQRAQTDQDRVAIDARIRMLTLQHQITKTQLDNEIEKRKVGVQEKVGEAQVGYLGAREKGEGVRSEAIAKQAQAYIERARGQVEHWKEVDAQEKSGSKQMFAEAAKMNAEASLKRAEMLARASGDKQALAEIMGLMNMLETGVRVGAIEPGGETVKGLVPQAIGEFTGQEMPQEKSWQETAMERLGVKQPKPPSTAPKPPITPSGRKPPMAAQNQELAPALPPEIVAQMKVNVRTTMSDGSVWIKDKDGNVTKVK